MTEDKYSFYRSELRVMQNTYTNNTEFLTVVANLIGTLTDERDEAVRLCGLAEHKIRQMEAGNDYS
jgi:hypothetical protein